MRNWHVDAELIDSYRTDALSPAMSASVESHVVACSECRALLTSGRDVNRAERNWSVIADRIDEPTTSVVERVLTQLGMRDHIARLLVLTPTFRVAWVGAIALVSALALMAASDDMLLRGDRGSFAFLVLAPLLPVIGVATAFTRHTDPAYELTASSPFSAFELLLIRAGAVLVASTACSALASLALPSDAASSTAWLLPALGLTMATLACARWMPVTAAAGGLSVLWLGAAVITARGEAAAQLMADYPAFRPAGQLAFLVLALIATALAVVTRHSFDLRRTA